MARVSTQLHFSRNTEEAFNFYRSVFGGDFIGGTHRFHDIPPSPHYPPTPESDKNLVVHVVLNTLGEHCIMDSDSSESMGQPLIQGNNIHISLEPHPRTHRAPFQRTLGRRHRFDGPSGHVLGRLFWQLPR